MSQNAKKTVSYEEMISRLEEIVSLLESGNLSLDETMKVYKEAMNLSQKCSRILEKFRGEITVVKNGEEVPLDESDLR